MPRFDERLFNDSHPHGFPVASVFVLLRCCAAVVIAGPETLAIVITPNPVI
jgi:hypothetical protein